VIFWLIGSPKSETLRIAALDRSAVTVTPPQPLGEKDKSSLALAPSYHRLRGPSAEPSHRQVDQEHDQDGLSNLRWEELRRGSPLVSQGEVKEPQELQRRTAAAAAMTDLSGRNEERSGVTPRRMRSGAISPQPCAAFRHPSWPRRDAVTGRSCGPANSRGRFASPYSKTSRSPCARAGSVSIERGPSKVSLNVTRSGAQ
jgi:hypothetical protein